MLDADRALEVLRRVPGAVVDGGWGVDALVGVQTRAHDDLDLVVRLDELDDAVDALRPLGYGVAVDERPTRVVLDDGCALIDLHLVSPADLGAVQLLPGGRRFTYVLGDTTGTIAGATVPCLSAPMQVLTHCGYEPDAGDRADMAAIAELSGESLPPPYVTLDQVELRTATLRDVAALAVVRQRSWVAAYTGRMPHGVIDAIDLGATWVNWCATLRVPPMSTLRVTVAGRPGEVHAFSVIGECRDDDAGDGVGEIRLLYADPTAWGTEVGATLMADAVENLHAMGFGELRLWTLRENDRARSFYERFGWELDGSTKVVADQHGSYVEVRYRLVA